MISESFNPIRDERKPLTFDAFQTILAVGIHEYRKAFLDPTPVNEWQEKPHTFDEWMTSFAHFMSW